MERTILHCDCNAYFASVESIGRPELKTVPMAVCGNPENRHGVILAKNELAKKYGVATGEPIGKALKKCPSLTLVRSSHGLYSEYSKKVNAIYKQYTDRVEPFGIDESWLDLTGCEHLFGDGKTVADELRRRVREELDLTISVGVSFNKFFAKMGSDYKKPDATTVITPSNFKDIIWPLPIEDMIFVGRSSAERLRILGIKTIGDIANAGREQMVSIMGKSGNSLWASAAGLDKSPVHPSDFYEPPKSVGNGETFAKDLVGYEEIAEGILPLCDRVGTRLRRGGFFCSTVTVHIKDAEFKTISRQATFPQLTNSTRELYHLSMEIIKEHWASLRPVRAITITASHLFDTRSVQLSLFDSVGGSVRNSEKLEQAVDRIRARYGRDAVSYAVLIKKDDD